ncbi:MAG: hypothetical protein DLM52_12520 [Chthoniobacterales bacterium]|nr:MAG: hypothetical protein DLM52_12520 [Chthoniobacterales bacterium]
MFSLDVIVRARLLAIIVVILPSIARADDVNDYAFTAKRAREDVLEHCRSECRRATHGLPCCETFEKAMGGDFAALTVVFTDSDYHSGDDESWGLTAWPLLHVVGDKRFAAWLGTLDVQTRNKAFDQIYGVGSHFPRAIKAGYFRRKFPQVEAIYRTLHRKDDT